MVNQKEAVYTVVVSLCGEPQGAMSLTKEQRKNVIEQITVNMVAGSVELSESAKAKFDTTKKIQNYVGGLVNNWLRKDTRLNGGAKHEAKNPGSRAGNGDDQLKTLRVLRKQLVAGGDVDKVAEVDSAIETRSAELKAEKAAAKQAATIPQIDTESIPAELREMLGI